MPALVILAGGKATRLKNKPSVKFNGVPMLKLIYDEISELFDEIVVSFRNKNTENKERIKKLTDNSRIIYDNKKFNSVNSPLVGIVSAFSEMKSDVVFVIPCDVPLIKRGVVELILSEIKGNKFDAAIPKNQNGFLEPLIAAYNRRAMLNAGEKALKLNKLSVKSALEELNVNYISIQKFKGVDPLLLSFKNINSTANLEELTELEKE